MASNTTPFREYERLYRRQLPPPITTHFHRHPTDSRYYISDAYPDVAIFKNFLSVPTQQSIMTMCVSRIEAHLGFDEKGQTNLPALYFPLPHKIIDCLHTDEKYPGKTIEDSGTIPNRTSHVQRSHTIKSATALQILQKLRWATIGYNYNWTTQLYDLNPINTTEVPLPIRLIAHEVVQIINPSYPRSQQEAHRLEELIGNLETVCKRTGRILPAPILYAEQQDQYTYHLSTNNKKAYSPDTGIINFYPPGSSLTGHVDRSEINLYAPLVSISLGRSCPFLLGGFTVDDASIAPLLLESGDVLVMWGSARRRYHGVPVISEYGSLDFPDLDEPLRSYMQSLRININVRQMGF